MSEIEQLLALDAAQRVPGRTDDSILHQLDDLTVKSWDFSSPTVMTGGEQNYAVPQIENPENYAVRFYNKYPFMRGVNMDNLLVAGGAAGQFVCTRSSESASDLDVFVYGLNTPEDATARVKAFIQEIVGTNRRHHRELLRQKVNNLLATTAAQKKQSSASAKTCEVLATYLDNFDDRQFFQSADGTCSLDVADVAAGDLEILRKLKVDRFAPGTVFGARTAGCVTYEISLGSTSQYRASADRTVYLQVIFRLYASKSEILCGFDLGSSAVGFDGQDVWFTDLGRFAHEFGYNIVDPSRRSLTYEARLRKYRNRGFDIIMPGLRVESLSRRNLKYDLPEVADLPFYPFSYTRIVGNRILNIAELSAPRMASDYDTVEFDDTLKFTTARVNLYNLINGKENQLTYLLEGETFDKVISLLEKGPHLTLEMVQNLYDTFRSVAWDGHRVNVNTLTRYVPVAPLGEALGRIAEAWPKENGADLCDAIWDEYFATQRSAAVELWARHVDGVDHAIIPWITENPGGQAALTGSLNPIITDPSEWYGEYYDAPAQ